MASAWLTFLKAYYQKHKKSGKTYKQCMVEAAKVYKKQKKGSKAKPEKKKAAPAKKRRRRIPRKEEEKD